MISEALVRLELTTAVAMEDVVIVAAHGIFIRSVTKVRILSYGSAEKLQLTRSFKKLSSITRNRALFLTNTLGSGPSTTTKKRIKLV